MPRESKEKLRRRADEIVDLLKRHYGDAECSLDFTTVHQLMVATILSAQCTDERVNMVTPSLFKKYQSVTAFANADPDELARDIFQTGFHNSKAKSLKNSAQALIEKYGGQIPKTLDELVKLPGVGRKTASVILGAGFGLAEGIVVDTHVGRISRLLGFTKETDPKKVEQDLMKIISKEDWIKYSHMLIYHGRAICKARKPECESCFLTELCPSSRV